MNYMWTHGAGRPSEAASASGRSPRKRYPRQASFKQLAARRTLILTAWQQIKGQRSSIRQASLNVTVTNISYFICTTSVLTSCSAEATLCLVQRLWCFTNSKKLYNKKLFFQHVYTNVWLDYAPSGPAPVSVTPSEKLQAIQLIHTSVLVTRWRRAKPGSCRHHNTWIKLKWNSRQVCQVLLPPPRFPSGSLGSCQTKAKLQERSDRAMYF